MTVAFYITAIVVLAAALRVVTCRNAVHALLYLVALLLGLALIFYLLGAAFAAALQAIIYAGAIVVLFLFVVMMLDMGGAAQERERVWLKSEPWRGPAILCVVLLAELLFLMSGELPSSGRPTGLGPDVVGAALFGPYFLAVELASFLLLVGLVAAWHLVRDEKEGR